MLCGRVCRCEGEARTERGGLQSASAISTLFDFSRVDANDFGLYSDFQFNFELDEHDLASIQQVAYGEIADMTSLPLLLQ